MYGINSFANFGNEATLYGKWGRAEPRVYPGAITMIAIIARPCRRVSRGKGENAANAENAITVSCFLGVSREMEQGCIEVILYKNVFLRHDIKVYSY